MVVAHARHSFGLCLCLTREQNASTTPTNENEHRKIHAKIAGTNCTMLQAVVRKLKAGHDYLMIRKSRFGSSIWRCTTTSEDAAKKEVNSLFEVY
jgi:hypothetical protein